MLSIILEIIRVTHRHSLLYSPSLRPDRLKRRPPSQIPQRRRGIAHAQEGIHAVGEPHTLVGRVVEVDRGRADDGWLQQACQCCFRQADHGVWREGGEERICQ